MIGPIHTAIKASLDSRTYTNRTYPTGTSISVIKGGPTSIRVANPVFEISYKLVPISASTINVYCRTGADNFQYLPGYGEVVCRTFNTSIRDFNNDRTVVYSDANYCVYEALPWVINGSIFLFTYERLRSDPTNPAVARNCVMVSTDGLVGKSFGPAVVASFTNYVIPSAVITNSDGTLSIIYGAAAAPTGIYKAAISTSYDGTLTGFAQVSTNVASEGGYLNIDGSGTVMGLYRFDAGAPLRATKSTNYGVSWTAFTNTIGAATGAKVTPKLIRCSGDSTRTIVSYNDRGAGNFDYVSSLNTDASLTSYSLRSPARFSDTTNSLGNSSICALSSADRSYLCVVTSTGSGNSPNNMYWWIFTDSVNVIPAPWR